MSFFSREDLLAVAIIVDVAIYGRGRPARSKEIAKRLSLRSGRQIGNLLQTLRNKGILEGKRGSKGGYRLARDASIVSVDEVICAVRGMEHTDSLLEKPPLIEKVITPVIREAVSEALQQIKIQQLVRSAPRTWLFGSPGPYGQGIDSASYPQLPEP
jgi:Rrf2 family iron-sulfur cluster assembly transcriptional regulator